MTTIRIQLDDATYERIRKRAEAEGRSVEEVVAEAVVEKVAQPSVRDPLAGWLADDPDLADAIDEASRRSRQERGSRSAEGSNGTDAA